MNDSHPCIRLSGIHSAMPEILSLCNRASHEDQLPVEVKALRLLKVCRHLRCSRAEVKHAYLHSVDILIAVIDKSHWSHDAEIKTREADASLWAEGRVVVQRRRRTNSPCRKKRQSGTEDSSEGSSFRFLTTTTPSATRSASKLKFCARRSEGIRL